MSIGSVQIRVIAALAASCALLLSTAAIAHGSHHSHYGSHFRHRYAAFARGIGGARVIQCVAFAKQDAGIEISGNARDWWGNAEGVYQRGTRPENGSVLSFQANGRMPLGHVAVVSNVQDSRTITIDQSHWNSRGIARDVEVKDVSDDNDWSAVRVQLAGGASFGSIYPTHGFIYRRPDGGSMIANSTHAPMPSLDPAPADLRRHHAHYALEVAEAPETSRPLDLSVPGISTDAPSRSLR